MKNKRAMQLLTTPNTKSSTASESPTEKVPIKKTIRKGSSINKHAKQKYKKAIPACSFISFQDKKGGDHMNRVYKEEETCFGQYPLFSVGLKELNFDNDYDTDCEQVLLSKEDIIANLMEALQDVQTDPDCIKNYRKRAESPYIE